MILHSLAELLGQVRSASPRRAYLTGSDAVGPRAADQPIRIAGGRAP